MRAFPKECGGVDALDQSLRDCKWRVAGRRAFVDPLAWQSSCRDGLLGLTVSRVPGSRGVLEGWSTGLSMTINVRGCVVSSKGGLYMLPARFS